MNFGEVGKQVLAEEIASLNRLYERFDDAAFSAVVDLIKNHTGKVVFTGIGKSGYIAQKLSSTFLIRKIEIELACAN